MPILSDLRNKFMERAAHDNIKIACESERIQGAAKETFQKNKQNSLIKMKKQIKKVSQS